MTIVQSKGILNVFFTFICNPNWYEIIVELEPNQTAFDHLDLVARVFQMKVKAFLKGVTKLDGLPKLLGKSGQGNTTNKAYLTSIYSLFFLQSRKFP
jgi:hypothetical protein